MAQDLDAIYGIWVEPRTRMCQWGGERDIREEEGMRFEKCASHEGWNETHYAIERA